MPNTTTYRQGDIVIVPFPFTDSDTSKKRPALVVSANWYNSARDDCVLVAITSTVHKTTERDELFVGGREATDANLRYDSVVRAGTVFTIKQDRIVRRQGRLAHRLLRVVLERVQDVFTGA